MRSQFSCSPERSSLRDGSSHGRDNRGRTITVRKVEREDLVEPLNNFLASEVREVHGFELANSLGEKWRAEPLKLPGRLRLTLQRGHSLPQQGLALEPLGNLQRNIVKGALLIRHKNDDCISRFIGADPLGPISWHGSGHVQSGGIQLKLGRLTPRRLASVAVGLLSAARRGRYGPAIIAGIGARASCSGSVYGSAATKPSDSGLGSLESWQAYASIESRSKPRRSSTARRSAVCGCRRILGKSFCTP